MANRFLQNIGNQTAKILVIATEKNPRKSEIRPQSECHTLQKEGAFITA
jgi:hypothetical protein